MDMFQAPTFVADGLSQIAEEGLNLGHSKTGKSRRFLAPIACIVWMTYEGLPHNLA